MTEILVSRTPSETMNCGINEESTFIPIKTSCFFFRMDLITKYNNQGLYPNNSCDNHFTSEFSFGAVERIVALDTSENLTKKTDYFNGLCQVIAS